MNELAHEQPIDSGLRELALFAGAGGGILGGHLLGWRTVCAVEWEPYPCAVLCARQNEGILAPFPIWDDVRTFDGKPWRGRIDVISGGFPCQDISAAGKGAGIDGARSGMWAHMARIVREVGPRFVFVENSPMLTSRGLGRVLGDLAAMGYDARWGVLGAVDAGAPHKRDRIWIVADAHSMRKLQPEGSKCDLGGRAGDGGEDVADTRGRRGSHDELRAGRDVAGLRGAELADADGLHEQRVEPGISHAQERTEQDQRSFRPQRDGIAWWLSEPDVGRVAHGVAARVDRLKAIGNGQVSSVAALAWRILSQ